MVTHVTISRLTTSILAGSQERTGLHFRGIVLVGEEVAATLVGIWIAAAKRLATVILTKIMPGTLVPTVPALLKIVYEIVAGTHPVL